MKITIFEDVDTLNEFLEHRKPGDVDIKFISQVVGSGFDMVTKKKNYEIVDRFAVITKD